MSENRIGTDEAIEILTNMSKIISDIIPSNDDVKRVSDAFMAHLRDNIKPSPGVCPCDWCKF